MAVKAKLKRISIKFNREIYKEAAVKEAARAYSGFADFTFSSGKGYLNAVIAPKGGPLPERLAEEFANMALCNSI